MNEHYFSTTPAGEVRRRVIEVELAGQKVRVETAASIFSPDGVDRGTQVLLEAVPTPPPVGDFLDLGSGWGPLALTMAMNSPQAHVTAVEVNERAAALTQANAARLGLDNVEVRHPDEVASDQGFDLIWSNPPIRIGKAALHELMVRWLPSLNPGGQAWLVVAKKLGADSLLPWITQMLESHKPGQFEAVRDSTAKGFRVLRISRTYK